MKIRNISPRGALDVPLLGRVVDAGAVTEVTKDQAERLLPQSDNWVPVTDPKPRKPAAPKAPAVETPRKGDAS